MGPTWPDVERLLTSTHGDRPREIRDHAILLLFALYAFRSGEVAALQLEDLHWHRELIVVGRPKQRRAQEYPLVPTVGRAILRYLQQVRPRCARRELFLTLKAPFRPLSAGAFYHLVSSRLSELSIKSLSHGPARSGMPALAIFWPKASRSKRSVITSDTAAPMPPGPMPKWI